MGKTDTATRQTLLDIAHKMLDMVLDADDPNEIASILESAAMSFRNCVEHRKSETSKRAFAKQLEPWFTHEQPTSRGNHDG